MARARFVRDPQTPTGARRRVDASPPRAMYNRVGAPYSAAAGSAEAGVSDLMLVSMRIP